MRFYVIARADMEAAVYFCGTVDGRHLWSTVLDDAIQCVRQRDAITTLSLALPIVGCRVKPIDVPST